MYSILTVSENYLLFCIGRTIALERRIFGTSWHFCFGKLLLSSFLSNLIITSMDLQGLVVTQLLMHAVIVNPFKIDL
jgi:hypothetical protein